MPRTTRRHVAGTPCASPSREGGAPSWPTRFSFHEPVEKGSFPTIFPFRPTVCWDSWVQHLPLEWSRHEKMKQDQTSANIHQNALQAWWLDHTNNNNQMKVLPQNKTPGWTWWTKLRPCRMKRTDSSWRGWNVPENGERGEESDTASTIRNAAAWTCTLQCLPPDRIPSGH